MDFSASPFVQIVLIVAPLQVSSRRSFSLTSTTTLFPLHPVSLYDSKHHELRLTGNNADTPAKPKATPKGKKSAPAATPSKKRTKNADSAEAAHDDEDEGRSLIRKRTKLIKAEDSDDD